MTHKTTSFSMIFSTTWTVRNWGTPVTGHGTSSVRVVILSPTTFSVSRTINAPGLDLTAIRGKTILCEGWKWSIQYIAIHYIMLFVIHQFVVCCLIQIRKKKDPKNPNESLSTLKLNGKIHKVFFILFSDSKSFYEKFSWKW